MKGFIINIIVCSLFEVFAGILLPSGKMKGICMSLIGFYLFYVILLPVVGFINIGTI